MPRFKRISSLSITARGTTGIFLARASMTSGLSDATALETTIASAAATCEASWPFFTSAPNSTSLCVAALLAVSEPLIV